MTFHVVFVKWSIYVTKTNITLYLLHKETKIHSLCASLRDLEQKWDVNLFFQIWIKWCGIGSFLYIFLWYTLFGFHTIMCSFSLHALCASGEKKLNFFSAVKFYESTCHFHSCLLIYTWMYKGSLVEVIRMCHSNYHLYFKKTIIRHFHCMRRQWAWSKQKQKDRDQCWIQTIQLSIKTLWVE